MYKVHACAIQIQFSACNWLKILISLLTEPPSPVHRDSEATHLLPNSRNHDYEAILLLPNPNRSNVEAVTGECQTPSLSSSTATDSREFMGGSNLPQAFPNYLICLRFITISTVLIHYHLWEICVCLSAQEFWQDHYIFCRMSL